MTKYKKITTSSDMEIITKENADGSISFIPKDESNSDYQAYLRWLNGEDENGTL